MRVGCSNFGMPLLGLHIIVDEFSKACLTSPVRKVPYSVLTNLQPVTLKSQSAAHPPNEAILVSPTILSLLPPRC